jgi:capsular polysaccharide biosynthesis protein
MSEQALNLRRSVQIVRRRKILVGLVTVAGLAIGSAYAVLYPPVRTSTAQVVLPAAVQSALSPANNATGNGAAGPQSYMATQVVVVTSNPVLTAALPQVSPATSLQALRRKVNVTSPTIGILSISANGRTTAQAEATANAIAASYISYVSSASSTVGVVSAHELNAATTATGEAPAVNDLVFALIGLIVGALIGIILALLISRADRRLRARDEIANSIGRPVLAALPVGHPADAAGWTKLLEDYEPGPMNAWLLRSALTDLGVVATHGSNGSNGGGSSLAILSLSSDPGAFALGPQLAVCAASLGIPTALVIGPQRDTDVTAALRTACAVPPPASSKRLSHLRVSVSDGGQLDREPAAALTIIVAVVDSANPQVADTTRVTATVLGVSAGAATAEQLARIALSAAADDREIAGIFVADPESTDRTSGRIARHAQSAKRRPPVRQRGMTTEIRR